MNSSTYLTPDEIAVLTGKKYGKVQAKVLAERAWKFELDADGKPLVLRAYHDLRMGLGASATVQKAPRGVNTADLSYRKRRERRAAERAAARQETGA